MIDPKTQPVKVNSLSTITILARNNTKISIKQPRNGNEELRIIE